MKKNKLKKKLAKTLKALSKAENEVSNLFDERAEIMKAMVDAEIPVKEIAELTSLTRQMVYKIVGKK